MSDTTATTIERICRELELQASAVQVEQLMQYLALLSQWNSTYNLTSIRDPSQMLTQHLADCLAVIPPLRAHLAKHPAVKRLLDVGSGGGLPGVVIAIMQPGLLVCCVDTVGKKAAFIQQARSSLKLANLHAEHARVEQMKAAPFDIITSRAFASLQDFTTLSLARLVEGGIWLAMKGKHPREEIAALPSLVSVFHVEQLQVPGLDAERCLVWMRQS